MDKGLLEEGKPLFEVSQAVGILEQVAMPAWGAEPPGSGSVQEKVRDLHSPSGGAGLDAGQGAAPLQGGREEDEVPPCLACPCEQITRLWALRKSGPGWLDEEDEENLSEMEHGKKS